MRIVFAGTPAPAVPSLKALLASDHEVVAVISRPDAPAGRGRKVAASPVAAVALDAGIELLTPVSSRDPALIARLRDIGPDIAAVVAYGAILRQDLLDVPARGWINLHFSILPAWRGAAPVQAAIRAGDDITGATTFLLEAGLDTGPVYGVVTERIAPRDTAGSLLDRLSVSGANLLLATMDGIAAGELAAVPQPVEGVSTAGKITVADAEIDWSLPAATIDRQVRATTPAPGAWTESPWGRLVLGPVEPDDADLEPAITEANSAGTGPAGSSPPDTNPAGTNPAGTDPAVSHQADIQFRTTHAAAAVSQLAPGELHVGRRQVWVGTGSGPVVLGTVQPTGKRVTPAADWARGVRPQPGEKFARQPDAPIVVAGRNSRPGITTGSR